ncbi:rna-directed dna polymerase from mobile element jockey-like [Limosa lapponica baueri]|uniref:Rna-directed dna polymerase from mobile element jockey-like n=1 Tax=Limosa lapponica baueri TaxID=1758121 RepID=A0A2I0UNF0_LIMLA|nr:rna-directed dna polymerase from mobile element jockey-like [Limosa lapponica baueri]
MAAPEGWSKAILKKGKKEDLENRGWSADLKSWEGVADMPKSHAAIQSDLNRLEKWANRNLMKFNRRKYKVPHLGRNNPSHQHTLKATHLENSFAEKDLGVLLDHKPAMCPYGKAS